MHLPEPQLDLSTKRLLTMTWLDGKPVMQMLAGKPSLELRNRIAYNMFRAWYVPFYYYGVIHGDPHLGNYTVRPNGDVNLLDFGCIRIFQPQIREGRDRSLLRAAATTTATSRSTPTRAGASRACRAR